ncbi:PilZ domain-containing protein [Rhizobium oryzicola]|uniref:PilZ domain-containing protein n=1 Tax=Rhizobium oryzicola TaxID=1232668 RepID=A0ABT8SSE8_9HYPH|nr:PilZ domain-containing protein [Rhizobium oryzicola]MDO1581334.1 PilZ domain-containing protein [Rhizobium oryzicola]
MSGKSSLKFLSLSLLAILTGCNSTSPTYGLAVGQTQAQPAAVAPVVQAFCPPVVLMDQTAVHSAYAGGNAKDKDQTSADDKLIYRASLADSTRSCTANETTMTITVMAQGRLVLGAAGKPGQINLPVNVQVVDGEKVIYSQSVNFPVQVPPEGSTQFVFVKNDVAIPNAAGGASQFTRVRVGFDEGSAAKTSTNRKKK